MKYILVTGLSFILTTVVIGNAFFQKKQFYPSVVYITKSNPSMAVLYIQAFVFVILTGKIMRKIFFGQLRAAEMEHLIERSWYAVTETCLAFTVFRDDFSPRFVALFTLLLFLKCFHWLGEDRVDYMERSPVISVLFHLRVLSLLTALCLLDVYFINHAYYSTILKGASVQLVFGFEYAILLTIIFMTFIKYLLHTIDLQSENPWENKAVFLLYTELIMGFLKTVLYVAFMVIMIKVHTFPLFAIRPMYLTMRSFKKALHDVIMSRRAIRNMNTLYPNATPEELQSGDNVCIICREEMSTASKKLPCNHIFHTNCLRSWFQRQQTCPTCRMDILRVSQPQTQAPQQPQQQQPQQPQFPQMPNFMFPGFPQMPPPWPQQQQQQQQQQQNVPTSQSGATSSSSVSTSQIPPVFSGGIPTTATSAANAMPFNMPPFMPFSPFSPFSVPHGLPDLSNGFENLSDEELRELEGDERRNVEARIMWLRDIQSYLNAAMCMINQYNTIAAQQSFMNINVHDHRPAPASQAGATATKASTQTTDSTKSPIVTPVTIKATDVSEKINVDITEKLDLSGLVGAEGYSPPKEEMIPKWKDPQEEEHIDEQHELRKRRLQKFVEEKKNSNDLALD